MISRHVFEVIVVVQKNGDILADVKTVATSSEAALVKANLGKICDQANVGVDDVEYIICRLGSLRAIEEVASTPVSKF